MRLAALLPLEALELGEGVHRGRMAGRARRFVHFVGASSLLLLGAPACVGVESSAELDEEVPSLVEDGVGVPSVGGAESVDDVGVELDELELVGSVVAVELSASPVSLVALALVCEDFRRRSRRLPNPTRFSAFPIRSPSSSALRR